MLTFGHLCLIILLFTGTIKAQQVVSTSGNHAENGSVQISWTVGETVIETLINGNNILTQGMHQSKLTVTAIQEVVGPGLEIIAFPNPATDCIHLQLNSILHFPADDRGKDFSFQLYDLNGKLLLYKHIEDPETVIRMEGYTSSTYFLKILENTKEIKTFKILKQ